MHKIAGYPDGAGVQEMHFVEDRGSYLLWLVWKVLQQSKKMAIDVGQIIYQDKSVDVEIFV